MKGDDDDDEFDDDGCRYHLSMSDYHASPHAGCACWTSFDLTQAFPSVISTKNSWSPRLYPTQ